MTAKIGDSLRGKRVLITQSTEYMGPALCEAFVDHGADLIADPQALSAPGAVSASSNRPDMSMS